MNSERRFGQLEEVIANLTIENQQAHQQINDKLDAVRDEVKEIMNFLRAKFS